VERWALHCRSVVTRAGGSLGRLPAECKHRGRCAVQPRAALGRDAQDLNTEDWEGRLGR